MERARLLAVALAGLALLLAGGCADDDGGETTPVDEVCGETTPLVSWETFGEGFLSTYCQGCHASTAGDRLGAPVAVFFDTEQDAIKWKPQILAEAAAAEAPTMPPNGGPSEADRERLRVWLTCFAD